MKKEVEREKSEFNLEDYSGKRDELIKVLQEVQKKEGYLSEESLAKISKTLKVPFSKVYGVATFYSFFKLKKTAKYQIAMCDGTACHVRGSETILNALKKELNIEPGEMTKDMQFSIEIVRCLGLCASAPVIKINDDIYPKVNAGNIKKIIEDYRVKK